MASSLNNRVTYLADIGMIAPLLGLLGTVLGIIRSFGALGADLGTPVTSLLSKGISEALINTCGGSRHRHSGDDFLRVLPRPRAATHLRSRIRLHSHPRAALAAVRTSAARSARRCCSKMNFKRRQFCTVDIMNLRGRAPLHHPGIQLAPLVDVLLLLADFFPPDLERGAERKRARRESAEGVRGEGETAHRSATWS